MPATGKDAIGLVETESKNNLESSSSDCEVTLPELNMKQRSRKTSTDASQQVTLSWHHINVFVKVEKKKKNIFEKCWKRKEDVTEQRKHILKDVTGVVQPGELLAVMGASGAGKTTLMNVLTNRNMSKLDMSGQVKVNGHTVHKSIGSISSYVQQDDLFIGTLTVKEHLIFQALLRMDPINTYQERMTKVEEVIRELGLMQCVNTRIGIPGETKGISGGERKRLAFASEVLTNPSILFCDEPTSGLDSFMAQSVVSVLRHLASGGRTIISTIHQPSSEVYAMFHNVLLLAEGRVAYMGDPAGCITFFDSFGLPVPVNYNPADFFINCLAIVPGNEEHCRQQVERICDQFEKERTVDTLCTICDPSLAALKLSSWDPLSKYKASVFEQMRALLWRSFLTVIRDPEVTKARMLQMIVLGFVFGIVYWRQNLDQNGIMNINGAFFLILTSMSSACSFAVITCFCLEIPLFLREHANGMYRTTTYFLSKTIAEMPIFILMPVLFTFVVYSMIGLNPNVSNFFVCMMVLILVANAATSFGYFISCMTSNIDLAHSIGAPILTLLMLFGGFYLNNVSIPIFLVWIKYLSWFFYGNQALVINQWREIRNITCNKETTSCLRSGETVIKSLNFEQENFTMSILLILVLIVFYRALAFSALFIKAKKQQ